ncbi:hypothetical protein [uncultured Sphingomonas sp.]|uniref:EF-hand domain-containing protein n=1 Tax=uncultured Sphingomonas sp. TaxID=158754 RepID=UPI0025F2B0AC|nr:hypothetical protein [uncultured Sphingomonas sp.]
MKTIIIGLALVASCTAARAQTGALPAHLAKMDVDGDGKLSQAEFASDRAKVHKMLDANRDGKVTAEEATAYFVKIAPAEDPKTVKRIAEITSADTNGDGTTVGEMVAVRNADFTKRDKNGDGFLTAEDM